MLILEKFLTKYHSIAKPAKASLWFVICYIIQRGIQYMSMPIYTRLMSVEEYGVYSVFLSWFNVICVFTSLNIYSGVFSKAMIKYESNRKEYISSIQFLTTILTLLFGFFILIFYKKIIEVTGFSSSLLLMMIIHLLMFPSLQYWSQEQRFKYEYKKLVLVTLINSVVGLILGILMVSISINKSESLIFSTVLVQAVICTVIYASILLKGQCFYRREYWVWSVRMALSLLPHYLSEILLGHIDRLMINHMCGSAQAGIYNIVYQISMAMTIIRTGINGAFIPWLYHALNVHRYSAIKKVTKLLTVLMGMITFFIMLVGPELLKMAAPNSYYEAVIDMPAIMIGCFFIFVYVLFLNIEIYYEENGYISVISVTSAILNIILNVVFIPKLGYLAAGYTTMLSYLVMAILHYMFLKSLTKKYKEISLIFDVKFIMILSIFLIVCGAFSLFLYNHMFLRYLILLIMIGIFVFKRNIFFEMIEEIRGINKI